MTRPRFRTVVLTVLLVAAAGAVIGALALFRLTQVNDDLRIARVQLRLAASSIRAANLRTARAQVAIAERRIVAANSHLYRKPELALVNLVPVARQNLQAVRRSVRLATRMAAGGADLLETARGLEQPNGRIAVSLRAGRTPLTTVVTMRRQMEELLFELPGPNERPKSRWLIGPVKRAQRDVYSQAILRRKQLSGLGRSFELLGEMGGANGPRRYLLAVANSAEMRGTGGMILSYGVLAATDGVFKLEKFGSVDEIKLPEPAPLDGPLNYLEHFAPFGPTLFWRSANLGSDFTIVGPAMEAMYTTATGTAVDGVIQIDSAGLAAILKGIGPVDVEELGQVNADNVVGLTLNEAYTRFPEKPVRQEYLEQVAKIVFERLVSGDYPTIRPLAEALVSARDERHVIMHAGLASAQRLVASSDASGPVPNDPDFAQLTVQNFSANKLDYYLDSSLKLTGQRPEGALGRLKAEVELVNNAPPGQAAPKYIFGPQDENQRVGEYHGLVSLYVPAGATVVASGGDYVAGNPPFIVGEGPNTAVRFPVHVPAGERRKVTVDIVFPPRPPGRYRVELVPVPRVRPTTVTVNIDGGKGRVEADGALTRRRRVDAR